MSKGSKQVSSYKMNDDQRKLVEDNILFVHYTLKKYMHISINNNEYEDYFQEGCIGMCMAAIHFNPDLGYKFTTYASTMIYGYIRRYQREKISLIKYPRSVLDTRTRISQYTIDNPNAPIEQMLSDLGITEQKYLDATNSVEYFEDIKLFIDPDNGLADIYDIIPDKSRSTEELIEISNLQNDIDDALDKLRYSSDRARQIFIEYIYDCIYVDKKSERNTQTYYANKYHISQAQVSRTIRELLKQLQKYLKEYL